MVKCIGLRFMGGEKSKTLADAYGVHIKSANRVINKLLDMIDNSDEAILSTDLLPKTPLQKAKLANNWNKYSGGFGRMYEHLSPLDEWLYTMQKYWDVPNPSDYRNGHYQRFRLNVQAMCDTNLRIIYISVVGPRNTNDARAYHKLMGLHTWMDQLESKYFCSGDNAYPLINEMLIPFSESERHDNEYNMIYNFYLSQLRIRVKMTFGRLTTKWRIFRSYLTYNTEKIQK